MCKEFNDSSVSETNIDELPYRWKAMIVSSETLAMMAAKYGGEATVNEIRIMIAIHLFRFEGVPCSHKDIHKRTGIPKATISRAVTNLIQKKWVREEIDKQDQRKRRILLTKKSLKTVELIPELHPTLTRIVEGYFPTKMET